MKALTVRSVKYAPMVPQNCIEAWKEMQQLGARSARSSRWNSPKSGESRRCIYKALQDSLVSSRGGISGRSSCMHGEKRTRRAEMLRAGCVYLEL